MRAASIPTSLNGNRRSLLACALALSVLLLAAEAAPAGTYDVVACNGGADNSWMQFADPGMTAYDACPNNPSQMISGMVARASVGSGAVGYLQGAYQVFSAPPGASLAQMTFTAAPYRWEQHWTVGFVAFSGDFNSGRLPWGCYAGQPGCGIVPPSFSGPYAIDAIGLGGHTQVRIEARCGNGGGCVLASSGHVPYTRATIAIANVSVRVQDFTAPGISVGGGGLVSGRWLKGPQDVSFDASDNVGIRETRVRIDGREVASRGRACDYSLRVPCPQGGDSYTVETAVIGPDGAHTLTLEALDTAGNVAQLHRPILVDNSPPQQPENLVVEGGQGWRSRNDFRLRWDIRPEQGAPLAGASFDLCPVGGGGCQTGRLNGKDPTVIEGLRVAAAGEYVLRVWLRDEAGNEDPKTAGPPILLRFDDEAPELSFENQDAGDPTRIAVKASDQVSGVTGGEIELRRRGFESWRPLPTRLEGGQLAARIDDERFADGTYELRARAVDRAGNERSTDRRRDGLKMEIALPIRARTQLRVGVKRREARAKHGQGRVRLLRRIHVRHGRRVRVAGGLTDATGSPIPYADVAVFERQLREGAGFREAATLRTSARGRFSYLAPSGPSRRLRFRYAGSATVRSTTSDVDLLVRARSTMRVSDGSAFNGETVTFSGRLRGGPIPAGKTIELQAHVRRRWRTFAATQADRRGVWRYRYRFDGTQGRQVYSFRARVPRESTYPYESGHSGKVKVTVVGV